MWGESLLFHGLQGALYAPWLKIQKEEIQMRNLKRTLSLVLAAVMLVGMMVVSASAASSDFTDKDEITYTEAAVS